MLIFITFIGYYAFGWYALLVPFYTIFSQWINEKTSIVSKAIITLISLVSIIAIPLICYNKFFTELRSEDVWTAGFPLFQADAVESTIHEIPFVIMAIVPTLFILMSHFQDTVKLSGAKAYLYVLGVILSICAMAYVVDSNNFDNYNYHAEFRMHRATEEGRWDDVLEESASYQTTPTREMVLLNHIALLNKGTMGSQMFKYDNFGEAPYIPDTSYVTRTTIDERGKKVPVLNDSGKEVVDTLYLRVHMVRDCWSSHILQSW